MLLTNKVRKTFFKYPYLETIIIIGVYLFAGYLANSQDICMLEHKFSFLTIILAIITLFHGISSGILAIVMIGFAMKFGYTEFPSEDFLKEFVLVLIFGEFHYYWNRTIEKHDTESKFTKQKLSELGKAFYMLKISHDQIEKSYVVKPMSLRNSIRIVKEDFFKKEPDDFYQSFLLLLQKTLNIEKAFLVSIDNKKKMNILAQTEENTPFYKDDLMIQDAYDKQMPLYVSSDDQYNVSKYIAVIPALSHGQVVGMLVIDKMPFMSFNKDNLISTTILVNYMFDELHKLEILETIDKFLPDFQENFRFETYRLHLLNQKFGAETTMLIFKSYDQLATHILLDTINSNMRTLDTMSSISKDELDVVAILFPFADRASVDGFVKRIDSIIETDRNSGSIKHSSFSISQMNLIESYVAGSK